MKRSAFLLLTLAASVCQLALGFEPVESKVSRVNSNPQDLTVELNGAKDLYLYADYGGDSYDCDQAIWASPKLIRKDGTEVDLTTLTPESAQTGWGELIVNKNHMGQPLQIGKSTYKTGFWAHAPSLLHFKLDGSFERFTVSVGLDRKNAARGSAVFHILDKPV